MRPHEDLRRHTRTDHHAGGLIITFAPTSWWAIDVLHVTAERAPAAIASYETLVERARVSAPKAHEGAIFESHNHRRVIALLHLDGHEAFRHLASGWDDHHLFAEKHAVAESRSLALYRLATTEGEVAIDPASTDAYAFEHVPQRTEPPEGTTARIAAASGLRGAAIFSDDTGASAILYRFARVEDIEALARQTLYHVRPVRTFA